MTRAKRYGIKINLVVCSAGTGVERLQVEIPVHWPIQWLRWEMRIELGRQQWGFWLRKHICDTVKLERILGQTMYGRWGRGSIAPRPQARVPGRDLTGASPPTTDLMTLHHNCLRPLTWLPEMWATAEPCWCGSLAIQTPKHATMVCHEESMRTIFGRPNLES